MEVGVYVQAQSGSGGNSLPGRCRATLKFSNSPGESCASVSLQEAQNYLQSILVRMSRLQPVAYGLFQLC